MSLPNAALLGVYHYDAIDRLAACIPYGPQGIQRFYQKSRQASELRGASGYTLLQVEDRLLAVTGPATGADHSTLLTTDQSNSVLHSVDPQQRQAFAYPPFGTSAKKNWPALPGYTGQTPDPITGHYLLGNGKRVFNSRLMLFNSPDGLSPFDEGGLNAYAYCKGDPINYTDPTGTIPVIGALGILSVQRKKIKSPLSRRHSMIADDGIVRTVDKALRRNSISPEPMSETRQYIDDAVKQLGKDSPFIQKLASVNRNLASHGDTNLTLQQAFDYVALAKMVDAGKKSNAGAHLSAAAMWTEKLRTEGATPSSLVGLAFNLAGSFTSGVTDHALHRTGAFLRRGS